MDILDTYRTAIRSVLEEYRVFLRDDATTISIVWDEQNNHYLLVETGWDKHGRIYAPIIHLDIIDGKIWVQHDGTEQGVSKELQAAGISRDHIVLAFHPPSLRKFTDYAIA